MSHGGERDLTPPTLPLWDFGHPQQNPLYIATFKLVEKAAPTLPTLLLSRDSNGGRKSIGKLSISSSLSNGQSIVYHLCTQDNEKKGRPYFLSTLHFCWESDIHPLFLIFVEDISPHLNIVKVGAEVEYKMAERLIWLLMKYSPMEAHFVFCALSPERGEGKDTVVKSCILFMKKMEILKWVNQIP